MKGRKVRKEESNANSMEIEEEEIEAATQPRSTGIRDFS